MVPILLTVIGLGGCAAPAVTPDPALQGRWQGRFLSETEAGVNGIACTGGAGAFNIDGVRLSGVAGKDYDEVHDLVGAQVADGAIQGEFRFRAGVSLGTFERRLIDGVLRGTFVDTELCRGTWSAAKKG